MAKKKLDYDKLMLESCEGLELVMEGVIIDNDSIDVNYVKDSEEPSNGINEG